MSMRGTVLVSLSRTVFAGLVVCLILIYGGDAMADDNNEKIIRCANCITECLKQGSTTEVCAEQCKKEGRC